MLVMSVGGRIIRIHYTNLRERINERETKKETAVDDIIPKIAQHKIRMSPGC